MAKSFMPELKVGSINLGEHDRDWFLVCCALSDKSVRAKLASIVGYFIRRRKSEYQEILNYTAEKYGLSPEDCFQRLLNGQSLGEPVILAPKPDDDAFVSDEDE